MGGALIWAFMSQPAYLLALAGGFLLVGPFLCLGLYDVSRRRERGETPSFIASMTAWRGNVGATAIFCAVLLVLEMLWSRTALVIFAVAFNKVPGVDSTLAMLPLLAGVLIAAPVIGHASWHAYRGIVERPDSN